MWVKLDVSDDVSPEYLQPWIREEDLILPGVVERRKRALEDDVMDSEGDTTTNYAEYEDVYTVSRKKSDPETGIETDELCMLIRLSASFTINFEAKPPSPVMVDTKSVDLPSRPDNVNGTCVMETEVAKIFMFWSGYNFTLEFIKNPEGNSYYMNRALIQYNTKHPDLAKYEHFPTFNSLSFFIIQGFPIRSLAGRRHTSDHAWPQLLLHSTRQILHLPQSRGPGAAEAVQGHRGRDGDGRGDEYVEHQVPALRCQGRGGVGRHQALSWRGH